MTRQYKLGQIATVDLRDVWPHEVLDFTKWLSENENLEILSEAVGIVIIAAEMLRRSRLRCCGVPRCAATR